jgi:PEP-CTERM motif
MLRKRRLDFIAPWASVLCASVLSAVSASADIRYVFKSDQGSFIYDSPSFITPGNLPASLLAEHSGNFDDVFFGSSDITLVNSTCKEEDTCFDAAFGLSGIFQTLGDYVASDGATLAISEVSKGAPIPEPSSWALLAVGFAGLAFARSRIRVGAERLSEKHRSTSRQNPAHSFE